MLYEIKNNITGEVWVEELSYAEMTEMWDEFCWDGDYEIREVK